ncbi:hypothetical protein HF086_017181, partial [Spodoptera exigua]
DHKVRDTGAVINILDIGRQNFANGGVVSRYLCDLAQCCNLCAYDYKDIVPNVVKDESVEQAIEEATQEELAKAKDNGQSGAQYATIRKRVEARALKVVQDISSAMSNNVLKFVAWVCHKAVRRVAGGGCGTRVAGVERLRRANAAGLPLVFVPLHRSHFDYILMTFTLYLTGLRPPLVAAGDNMRIPFFGFSHIVLHFYFRAYILNSLSAGNNLEFFIEGGRTRTGKPQTPKAGILSVIMDAYLDGTIDDALLVPATLNYDKLVDGNFVREQLGMPKQMETFWSALRGIWRTLNTNHGSIRVDFNQPISLKELVTSFQKYQHYKAPIETCLTPPNNNLAVNLDRQILYNHSHSSLYGADVSTDHKMMVEAIGRHLVYDAAQATALMCTNVVAYVLLTEARRGAPAARLAAAHAARRAALANDSRDLAYAADSPTALKHALEMLGRGLVRRDGDMIRPGTSIAAQLELAYYANTVVAHYAAPAIVVSASLQLCEVLSHEFIICAPCQRIQDRILDVIDSLESQQLIIKDKSTVVLEEQQWSRRMARRLEGDDEDDRPDPTERVTYTVSNKPEAIAERRRLLLTIRPLLEAYSVTCRHLQAGTMKDVVKNSLDSLTEDFTQNKMLFGEAVSTDAIRNCLRLLRQWGVIHVYTEGKARAVRLAEPYTSAPALEDVCHNIHKFNMNTPLLLEPSNT